MKNRVQELANEILKNHEPNKYDFVLSEALLPESENGAIQADRAYQFLVDSGFVTPAPQELSPMKLSSEVLPRKPFKLTDSGIAKRDDLLSE